jgi:N-methylhydantoinase B
VLGEEIVIVMRADRQRFLPWALEGGQPGTPSFHLVKSAAGQRVLPQNPMGPVSVRREEVFEHLGAGGAGVGDPLEREPVRVLDDVREERITAAYAFDVYGVAIEGGRVDEEKTSAQRHVLRSAVGTDQPAYLKHYLEPLGVSEFRLEGRELQMRK